MLYALYDRLYGWAIEGAGQHSTWLGTGGSQVPRNRGNNATIHPEHATGGEGLSGSGSRRGGDNDTGTHRTPTDARTTDNHTRLRT